MKAQPLVAELVGTFALTLVVLLSLGTAFVVPTPVLAGLTLGLMVYIIGPISGAHCNPAVTIGLYSIRKMNGRDALWYVVMQMVGAFLASMVGLWLLGDAIIAIPVDTVLVGAGEALGAAVLFLGVIAVVLNKVNAAASGLVIGTALTLGAHIASVNANGVINPAVALGIGSFSWMYALAPIIGAILAGQLYRWLIGK